MDIKKRLLAAVLSVCVCASFMAACGDKTDDSSDATPAAVDSVDSTDSPADDESSEAEDTDGTEDESSDSEEEKEDEEVTPINVEDGATEEMLERAFIYNGDLSRLAAVIERAQADKFNTTNICYFGDSISAGSGATSGSYSYASLFEAWWSENISINVQVQNASIGATDSYLAVHRFNSDIAEVDCEDWNDGLQNPQIVIIEYINDENTEFYKETMDSLVRKALSLESNPAVIIIEPTTQSGSSPQDQHLEVAKHYEVPFISYHDAVMPEIEKGAFEWTDISNDTVHPNNPGHAMIAQMLEGLVNYTIENMDTIGTDVEAFDPATESLTGDKYANADRADRARELDTVVCVDEGSFTEQSAKAWPYVNDYATYHGGSTTWEITAQNIGIAYYRTTSGNNGVAKIIVDGEEVTTIDGNFPNGWGSYTEIASIYSGDEVATHTVTVEVEEGDADDFYILSWLVS